MSEVPNNNDASTHPPSPSGFDIRTFQCPASDQVHQRVVELIDPMKSSQTAGWR